MGPNRPKWLARERVASAAVFVAFTLINYLLLGGGSASTIATRSPAPPGQVEPLDIWLWVVAFPVSLAARIGLLRPPVFDGIIWLLNSLFYGGMGWFAWRMWKLMRRKPE